MNYVYMDNYRGFTKTLIPLRDINFLVGENSTGKSSFLSLLYLLSEPSFWIYQNFSPTEFCNLGGFMDIVSVAGNNHNSFTIGVLETRYQKNTDKSIDDNQCSFSIMTFRNDEGMPRLSRYVQFIRNKMIKISFGAKSIKYKIKDVKCPLESEDDFLSFFKKTLNTDSDDKTGFTRFTHVLPPRPPLPVVIAILMATGKRQKKDEVTYKLEIPTIINDLELLAPIRTKPRRTYDGFKTDFSPEGDHTPYIIRKTLHTRDKSKKFAELLNNFGESSGLFKAVKAHSFGHDTSAPFEVQVHLYEHPLNISNVGYGVSQVLPVVVEMLTRPKKSWFAIQQPEVHLHPKAQAALGDLMHYLATEREYHYLIETHSDYLIDRFRLRISESKKPIEAQVIFFERIKEVNHAYPLLISPKGQYPPNQPKSFRDFFIKEEMKLLEI